VLGTAAIVEDDQLPALFMADTSVVEEQSGITPVTFTVTLSFPSGQDITVDYATADRMATVADSDYVPASATLIPLQGRRLTPSPFRSSATPRSRATKHSS
jgi:hypothetical protein